MKVNILMSTYNGEKYLDEQIQSIQAQTYTEWKLLIRDDGSSDRTVDIIKKYVSEDPRIHWINEDESVNLGVIKSFYTLVKYETADIYFFSDQDDVWLNDKLASQLEVFAMESQKQPTMVYMDLTVVNQELQVLNESMVRTQSGHPNTKLYQELTENTVTGGVAGINHALATLWQDTEDIIMHDWYLALQATAFGKLVYIDKPGELYRQHENNVLGARTLNKRVKKWLKPSLLFSTYWSLIKRSQQQARHLLSQSLSAEDRELVEAFVTILEQPIFTRIKRLTNYQLKKNKWFHTLIFRFLIITKFSYKE